MYDLAHYRSIPEFICVRYRRKRALRCCAARYQKFAIGRGKLVYNGFHLTLGALYNGNEAGLGATAGPGATIGGFTVPAGQSAGLRGDLSVDSFSPYVGLGYDTTFTSRSSWTFTVRAGVLYQGDPDVALRQTSGASTISQADLDAEARAIEDDLGLVEFFPVVSVGLNYRF